MKKIVSKLTFTALLLATATNATADDFPATDPVTGDELYYKIESACTGFNGKCMTDNRANAATSPYAYTVEDFAAENTLQEWQLAASNGAYYLRNRSTHRYICIGQSSWVGNYLSVGYSMTRSSCLPFTLTALEDGETALSYSDDGGDHYLCAADSAQSPQALDITKLKGSPWAWKIVCTTGTSAVNSALADGKKISVKAQDRSIIVTGTEDFRIFDFLGRQLPKTGARAAGTYIVRAGDEAFKILIQ